jgi:hypothetical protein
MSSLAESIKQWLNQEHTSGTRKFLQMTVLILGGILAMGLGIGLVGLILIASPFLTVVILLFLVIYGLVTAFKH